MAPKELRLECPSCRARLTADKLTTETPMHLKNTAALLTLVLVGGMTPLPALSALFDMPGQPILIETEGGDSRAAWVAYENGDVARCNADTGRCELVSGLPQFARPVALAVEQGRAAAWVGWSDGHVYRCEAGGRCTAITAPQGSGL